MPTERGVYTRGYDAADGSTVLVAVDSDNRKVAQVILYDESERGMVVDALWTLLGRVDPMPHAPPFDGGPLELVD